MKAKYILWSMVCLLAACSQEETMQEEPAVALQVSTEMSTTRGVITGTSFAKGDEITVAVLKQNGNLYEENRYYDFYEYDGTGWKRSSSWGDDLMLTSEEGVVYACYPPQDSNWIEKGYWVTVSPSWSGEQNDYLYGKGIENVSSKNPKARLRFQFALARLTFQIIMGETSTSAQVLSRVKLATVLIKGTMDVKTGNILSSPQDYGSVTLSVNKTLSATAATQVDVLVIPTTTNTSVKLTLTINDTDYDISIPVTTWEKGKQYTYPVVLNIGSQQQQPESGKAGEKVYMGFNGDNGKPLYWSSWNLGAKKVEDYGGLYGWGDPTGEHKEHCYEYEKDDPYYMTDKTACLAFYGGSSPILSISGVNDYDTARRLWGGNWRIPTSNEFNMLKTNSTYVWTTQNNVYGMKFTSKTNGNSIFLPYAPKRYGNFLSYSEWNTVSGTYYQGSDYWSSNLNTDDVTRAHMFDFSNNNSCWIAKGSERYAGLPIRPVTE